MEIIYAICPTWAVKNPLFVAPQIPSPKSRNCKQQSSSQQPQPSPTQHHKYQQYQGVSQSALVSSYNNYVCTIYSLKLSLIYHCMQHLIYNLNTYAERIKEKLLSTLRISVNAIHKNWLHYKKNCQIKSIKEANT